MWRRIEKWDWGGLKWVTIGEKICQRREFEESGEDIEVKKNSL